MRVSERGESVCVLAGVCECVSVCVCLVHVCVSVCVCVSTCVSKYVEGREKGGCGGRTRETEKKWYGAMVRRGAKGNTIAFLTYPCIRVCKS